MSRNARAVELMVQRDFLYSLMMLCYCVLHVLKHFLHWNCCVKDMWSHLQLLKFEGSLARKLRFRILNSWNLTEASHESRAVFADRSGMAASGFIVAAAACVILLYFGAKSQKSQ